MKTTAFRSSDLSTSVVAVPPLSRHEDGALADHENRKLIRHLESNGVTTILYGGNANIYDMGLHEFAKLVVSMPDWVAEETWVIPSIGPSYGLMLDQIEVLRDLNYPTVMVLPSGSPHTPEGLATGVRRVAERLGKPVILYVKRSQYVTRALVEQLVADGVVCAVKYAVVRSEPGVDPYLEGLCSAAGSKVILSGMGERPVIAHMRQFRLAGFTSGSVCVAPRRSAALLGALLQSRWSDAEGLRDPFLPLEDLRDALGPARVLHEAVTATGVADMGPISPLLSGLDSREKAGVARAAGILAAKEGGPDLISRS